MQIQSTHLTMQRQLDEIKHLGAKRENEDLLLGGASNFEIIERLLEINY